MIGPITSPCDEGVIRGAARDTRGCEERARWWVLAATIVGSSMAFVDSSVVNVALPAIQSTLRARVSDAQWMVNAYMLTLGALILVGGASGDRFGRRRVFLIGVVAFTAASVACGLAPNPQTLIAARALQGIGGALLVPNSLAIISAAFPEQERGRAIGMWAGASAFTSALGPVVGGWLVDTWSWRVIFFINVPIAIVAYSIAAWHVPETRDDSITSVDWTGGFLAVVALGAITYGLTAAADGGWLSPTVLACLIGGMAVFGVLLWSETRVPSPMVPLSLFRSRTFTGANAITLLLYFALGGALFFVPFNLIRVQGYSAAVTGAAFLPFSLIMGALSRWAGGLVERYGARRPLMVGPAVAALGFALLAVPGIGGSYWTTFFPALAVLGLGMGVSVAPLTTAVMSAVEDRHAGVASGINNAIARIAGMLAVALLGALAVGAFGSALDERLAQLPVDEETRQALHQEVRKLAEAEVPPQITGERREALEAALRESFVHSFRVTTLIAAVVAFLSTVCAWATIEPHVTDKRAKPRTS